MNVFQLNYDARLRSWYNLRAEIEGTLTQNKAIEIDSWWQKAPLVNHYLHPQDSNNWPGPWDLLVENTYCTIARALGMCYTLLLVDENDIEMVEATDKMGEDVVLVLVDNAKYILNYWPDTALSNTLTDFTIKRNIDISNLKIKI
jgi:hypothetical protein